MDWREATGDDTLLDLVREGREKNEEGSENPTWGRWKIKGSILLITRASVLTSHTALEILCGLSLQVDTSTYIKHSLGNRKLSHSNERKTQGTHRYGSI